MSSTLGASTTRAEQSDKRRWTDVDDRSETASDEVESALEAAQLIARNYGSVVAISGATDAIVSADQIIRVGGGAKMLTRVTGGGCALGAFLAARTLGVPVAGVHVGQADLPAKVLAGLATFAHDPDDLVFWAEASANSIKVERELHASHVDVMASVNACISLRCEASSNTKGRGVLDPEHPAP